jgi:hypothetical protein
MSVGAIVLSFTFSLDQLGQAPSEVRHWFENELARSLRGLTEAQHEPPVGPSTELAACTIEEALELLQLIKGDFAAIQVFLELAREMPIGTGPSPLHALSIGQIKRQLRRNSSTPSGSSTRLSSRSAMLPMPRYSGSTGPITFICTKRPTAAFGACGSDSFSCDQPG